MTALFFYLSRNPEAYRKLADEIRSVFADAEEIKGGPKLSTKLSSCHFLRACIDDALRLSPPVAGTLWFELAEGERTKNGPLVVDGHVIPPDTMLGVDIHALHHHELYFPDPFVFKPERWVFKDDPAMLRKVNSAFDAFSVGSRGCAGKSMAYLEAGLVIASTLWCFDFETAPGPDGAVRGGSRSNSAGRQREGEFQLYDGFTSSHDGLNLVFRPRGDHWKEL